MKYITLFLLMCLASCSPNVDEMKIGERAHIPFSKNQILRCDSSVVIFDRETGKVLQTINLHK